MNTPTKTLIKALRVLANDIQSEDGVANAAILEAAQRMEEMDERIKRLEEALSMALDASWDGPMPDYARNKVCAAISKAKEAKP